MHSLSEGKGNKYKGLVIKNKHRNSFNSTIGVICVIAGEKAIFNLKLFSPLVANLKIVHKT